MDEDIIQGEPEDEDERPLHELSDEEADKLPAPEEVPPLEEQG